MIFNQRLLVEYKNFIKGFHRDFRYTYPLNIFISIKQNIKYCYKQYINN